ncbi:MAG: hypothetical protein GQ549_07960 [Gammaproteobacteria bacterium]|nr:hypothetical protein [Gammaproteobacteria bacterium]
MSEELFDVVFFGILQAGKDKESVMQNMATLFKTDAAKLAPYFAGGRKVIKGKISTDAAEKYRAALENLGLVIKVEPSETTQSTASSDKTSAQAQQNTNAPTTSGETPTAEISTGNMTMAEAGSDVLENPTEVVAQKIDDISSITMAETGADVLENPVEVIAQEIGDISDISMAEAGADVLDHPQEVIPQKIDDISGISMAEAGSDLIENPKAKEKAKIPDTSELSLDDEKI